MAVFEAACRRGLQIWACIKREGSRRELGTMKGKKLELRLMHTAGVPQNHTLSAIT